jgi:alpha-L-fucosidase
MSTVASNPPMSVMLTAAERAARFAEWRYGMLLCWGVYSAVGRGEWLRFHDRIPADEYRELARKFQPADFDARRFARLAKAAGMRYAMITAKNPDGYCLFDSAYTDMTSAKMCGRDFVAEWCEALREEGIAVGLYLSVKDWDVPEYFTVRDPKKNPAAWEPCVQRFHNHARELATNYGQIDLLWFDAYDDADFTGAFNTRADEVWRSSELLAELAALQPNMLINDRAGVGGDFRTPEQEIPHGYNGTKPFESCMTLNEWIWGYTTAQHDELKSARQIALALTSISARGGNFLLNVGPDGDGRVPEEQIKIYHEVGHWIEREGAAALFGAHPCLPAWWDYTLTSRIVPRDERTVHLVVTSWHGTGEVFVGQLDGHATRASLVAHPEIPLRVQQDERGITITGLPAKAPSVLPPIIRLDFSEPHSLKLIPRL